MVYLENNFLHIAVCERGGTLSSIRNKQTQMEYLWSRNSPGRPSSPNLFPFIGRLYGGVYTLHGKQYSMAMHGFLSDMDLSVEDAGECRCIMLLKSSEETRKQYPYEFELYIEYTLEDNELKTSFHVKNTDPEIMFCAVGGHPAFRVPLEEGLQFEDYDLVFSEPCHPRRVEFTDSVLYDGVQSPYPLMEDRRIPLRHELFLHDALVLADTSGKVSIVSEKGKHGVSLSYPDIPYVGFWQFDKPGTPFICIEPWSALPGREGITEELERMDDMFQVLPGETLHRGWTIKVW